MVNQKVIYAANKVPDRRLELKKNIYHIYNGLQTEKNKDFFWQAGNNVATHTFVRLQYRAVLQVVGRPADTVFLKSPIHRPAADAQQASRLGNVPIGFLESFQNFVRIIINPFFFKSSG